jgi:hypothetical protein
MTSGGNKMGRGYEEERIFSENIDRLLSGESVTNGAEIGSDLRTALDFASKITALRIKPSPSFQASLKARLFQQLNEQETLARPIRRGWFWGLIPQEPVWQAVATLAIMIVVGGVAWGILSQTTRPPVANAPITPAMTAAPTTATAAPSNAYLTASASTNKSIYASNEPVSIHMTWQNVTGQNLTIDEFPPILSIMNKSSGQPAYTFTAGKTSKTLAPGEKTEYTVAWNQLDANGRKVVPGSYYLELEEMYYQGKAVTMKLTQPANFIILPASGSAGNAGKILNLGQSQTVSGITVTLQRIEISDNGITVSAFVASPPDYVLLPGTPAPGPAKDYTASAGYSIDGDWVRDTGVSSVEYFGNGMETTWYIPEPVPQSAGEMTFIINHIGDWTGPWQFIIPLN